MIEQIISWLGYGLVVLGSGFLVVGAVGMLRFKDFFLRLHPASIKDALGIPLVIIGMMLLSGFTLTSLKLLLLLVFLILTNSTASHAAAQSAYRMEFPDKLLQKRKVGRPRKTKGKTS